jgi:hypothetical protein
MMTVTGKQLRAVMIAVALLLLAAPLALPAQGNAQCASRGNGIPERTRQQNICDAAVDGATLFLPVAGILVTGGNPFLGATGGVGGFPHLGITIRVNATQIVIPDVTYDGDGNTVAAKQKAIAPAPLIEGALGLYRGSRNGALALDLLGSAQLLPTRLIDDVHIDVNARSIGSVALGLGIGGRLTLIGDNGTVPAVTVSVMRRTLPRIGVGNIAGGDRYSFSSDLTSTEYRATLGKRFGALDLSAGAGWTDSKATAQIDYLDPSTGLRAQPVFADLSDSRKVGFIDAGLAIHQLYLIAEGGLQEGKELGLVTTFTENDPAKQRLFVSFGLRFGF